MYALSHTNTIQPLLDGSSKKEELINKLTCVLKERDEYTANHNLRVGSFAAQIAIGLGLPTADVTLIYEAGCLHDIGKLSISPYSISKPGALSVEEYDEVKRHPELGAKILQRLPPLIHLIEGVLYHHERYDGTGYPFRLSGEQIPLSARIIAVADAFDAMTSDRAYRRALDQQRAIDELRAGSGSQFDPKIMEVAIQIFTNKIAS
jgi:diguanylate cyclase